MIIHSLSGFTKKKLYKMSQYFPKPYESFGGDINVKVDLSGYAKQHLKNATWVDASKLSAKSDLASLKAIVENRRWQMKDCSCWFKQTKQCSK